METKTNNELVVLIKESGLEETKAKKEREALEEKARKEREKQEAILQKEREEKAKIEAQLKAQKEKEKAEAERIALEEKAKKEAERKASLAPDKDKLLALAKTVQGLELPSLTSEEAKQILKEAKSLLNKVGIYLEENASKM